MTDAKLIAFLREAAAYFRNRDTHGEDRAYWANVYNGENCEKAATALETAQSDLASLRAERDRLRGALGNCITVLSFEAERALREQDAVAALQITEALRRSRATMEGK